MEGAKGGLFRTVLFVDEVHRWSKAQQDVLLPAVEEGTVTLIGATTENPYFSLNTPLLSRCLLLRLEPLGRGRSRALLRRALADEDRGLGGMQLAIDRRRARAPRDRRRAATPGWRSRGLEAAALAGAGRADRRSSRCDVAADAVQRKAIVYDRRATRTTTSISAFIKSIRGSDPDAALFWLARMLEAGEDPRFIARRLIVHASEDVGLADSDGAARGDGGRARRRARGAARGAAQPGARHDLPGARPEVEQRLHGRLAARMEDAPRRRAGARCTCATPATGAPQARPRRGLRYPHDYPGQRSSRSTGPPRSRSTRTTSRRARAEDSEDGRPRQTDRSRPGPASGSGRLRDHATSDDQGAAER